MEKPTVIWKGTIPHFGDNEWRIVFHSNRNNCFVQLKINEKWQQSFIPREQAAVYKAALLEKL